LPSVCLAATVAGLLMTLPASALAATPTAESGAPAGRATAGTLVRLSRAGRQAPIRAVVQASSQDTLRASLNGHGVSGLFVQASPSRRIGLLGANDRARAGMNVLRVSVRRADGRVVAERHVIELSRGAPVAGAGSDRRVEGLAAIALSARSSRAAGGARLSYRWRVIHGPRGAGPILQGANTADPRLDPSVYGTYRVRLTVVEHSAAGRRVSATATPNHDTVTVNVGPDDPPIGVPIDTLADANGDIVIDGSRVPGTGGGAAAPVSYAVLNRSTRAVQASGHVTKDGGGLALIKAVLNDYASDTWLVIINGTAGIDQAQLGQFETLLKSIGGGPLQDDEKEALALAYPYGRPFSVIGVPSAPAGSLQSTFFSATSVGPAQGKPAGDLSGLLQLNTGVAEYGFVFKDYVPFSTDQTSATIKVAGATYSSGLGAGKSGFHVLALDSRTLAPLFGRGIYAPEQVYETNTGNAATDAESLGAMLNWLNVYANLAAEGSNLVIVQTIGRPKAETSWWGSIADRMSSLGGTAHTFDILDGSGGYSLVGRGRVNRTAEPVVEAAQTSTQTSPDAPAQLSGVLSRGNDGGFSATLADPNGTLNTGLLEAAYQPSKSFPAFTAAQQAANANIARRLGLVNRTDVRENYWHSYTLAWGDIRARMLELSYPTDGPSFSVADFASVKTQLAEEISAVVQVKTFIANLQSPNDSQFASYLDLQAISKKIQEAVKAPDVSQRTTAAKIIQYGFLAISKLVPGDPGKAAALFSSAFQYVAGLQGSDGSETLGRIQTTTTQLGNDLLARYAAARSGLSMLGQIIVSDYGKLTTVARESTGNPAWTWPADDTLIRTAMRKGAKRYFYSQLLPLVYVQYHLTGPIRANEWYCMRSSTGYHAPVFRDEPDSGQYVAIDRYRDGPFRADTSARALGQSDVSGRFASQPNAAKPPPASLMDPLFKPLDRDAASDNLGLDKAGFFEGVFTTREEPVPFGYYC
jgi:hypothetical protein